MNSFQVAYNQNGHCTIVLPFHTVALSQLQILQMDKNTINVYHKGGFARKFIQ